MNQYLHVGADGKVEMTPSEASSQHDFDFIIGDKFTVKSKRLVSRLTGCDEWAEFEFEIEAIPALEGRAHFELAWGINGATFHAATYRLFNPGTKLWSLYWTNSDICSIEASPQVGSFDGDIGTFFANDVHEGRPVLCVFKWDRTDPDAPIWSQALSEDGVKTWEWNFFSYHFRA